MRRIRTVEEMRHRIRTVKVMRGRIRMAVQPFWRARREEDVEEAELGGAAERRREREEVFSWRERTSRKSNPGKKETSSSVDVSLSPPT